MNKENSKQITVGELARGYAGLQYRIRIESEDLEGSEWFTASHPELPGCMADGASREEAIANLEDVRAEYIQVLLDRGVDVPVPAPRVRISNAPSTEMIVINLAYADVEESDSAAEEVAEPFKYEMAA